MRILRRILAGLATLLAAGLLTLVIVFPRAEPPSQERIARTPERIARGEYLARNVAFCFNCHSERDWSRAAGPIPAASFGAGGSLAFLRSQEHAPNITPYSLSSWSEGEILRAVTAGVDRHGRALGPRMPFDRYAAMPLDDARAIVAYLRTLPPVAAKDTRVKPSIPRQLFARLRPRPYRPPAPVSPANTVEYGRYLLRVAGCDFCHGAAYQGGLSFSLPGGQRVQSTPIPGNRDRASFIAIFQSLRNTTPPVAGKRNTVMPWFQYAQLSDADLGAIYDALRVDGASAGLK